MQLRMQHYAEKLDCSYQEAAPNFVVNFKYHH